MPSIPDTLEALRVPIDTLEPYPGNARRGRVDVVAASLELHGQYRPIVVNARTRQVLAGNHTMEAAKSLGWTEIAATFVDVDDDAARRIVLVDNRTNDVADYDDDDLVALLESLEDLDGTGWTAGDLDALLGNVAQPPPDTSPQLSAIEYRLIVRCDDERQQADLLQRLQGEGLNVQAIAQ